MSMKLLSILQIIEIFSAYSLVVLLLPVLVLRKKVEERSLSVKFMIYFVTGNFYIINLVFILQLLHISNQFTLIFFTVVPALLAGIRINKIPAGDILKSQFQNIRRLADGQMGRRSLARKIRLWFGKGFKNIGRWFAETVLKRMPEWILVLGITALICWLYGSNALRTYGYCASDIPVHNYWVNYMSKDHQIFVDGVYPFGFHCVIYYLHTVFGIKTYVLLRLFWLIQTIFVHYVLLSFLKACCRTKFLPYAGTGVYTAANIFAVSTYSRYYSSLPQEFGMLFILPSIYFLMAYFKKQKEELESEETVKNAKGYLAGFVMSFSLTFAVHFYCTMIAGLFCLGIGVGYGFRFFKKKYFVPIVVSGMLSLVIAILPMGIAYATGTPLQGSLNWGMSVMSGGKSEDEKDADEEKPEEENPQIEDAKTTAAEDALSEHQKAERKADTKETTVQNEVPKISMKERLMGVFRQTVDMITEALDGCVALEENPMIHRMTYAGIGLALLFGVLFMICKQPDYGAGLISTAVFMILMSILLASGGLGIPELMDTNRCSIFYAYMLPVLWTFCVDAVLVLLLGWFRTPWVMHLISFAMLAGLSGVLLEKDMLKEPLEMKAFESNEAVTCLTNILHDNEDGTWTICSANDELRMCEDHGYHMEPIDLLRRMEKLGPRTNITIPTHYVYFFIEKIPLDYALPYEDSGQSVSPKGAEHALPATGGLSIYQGENRWIVMSRMYYWAEEFRRLYPNEMKVYYETEDFICYRIEQNDYSLYNFAIDYYYNMKEYKED